MTDSARDDAPEAPALDHVRFEDVVMRFGEHEVLGGLTCGFPRGKISVILGGSGSGKSTTLRLIGGLIKPSQGRITVDGDDVVNASNKELARIRLKLGMMFQGGALLDSTNVFDNIAFPLREHTSKTDEQIWFEVRETLGNVGLKSADARLLPSELSGGMVKRVALARAIIMKPAILLCDEPLSGLDPITSKRIELLLAKINRESGMTLIVISHDAPSTMRLADHLLILLPSRSAEGVPAELAKSKDPCVVNLLSNDVDERLIRLADVVESRMTLPTDLESTWS